MEWIPVTEKLPVKPGEYSTKLYFVHAQEFGCQPEFYVCRCWISIIHPNDPAWYMDNNFYHITEHIAVGSPVLAWIEIPAPMPYPTLNEQMRLPDNALG